VVRFPVFAAVALAGLGALPDTLMARSVIIRMRRRAPHEKVQPFRQREHGPEGRELGSRLGEWVTHVANALTASWPEMPAGVEDRPADVWEPLLAVADAAGGDWPDRARTACVELCKVAETREASLGIRLLADVRSVLAAAGVDRLWTEGLLAGLCAVDEAPWLDLRGKPLGARGLARLLGAYDVRSHQFKVTGGKVRGYSISGSDEHGGGLYDAFARYLSHHDPGIGTTGTAGTSQVTASVAVPDGHTGTGTPPASGTPGEPLTCDVPLVPHVPPPQAGGSSGGHAGDPDDGTCNRCRTPYRGNRAYCDPCWAKVMAAQPGGVPQTGPLP